jgi:hypothetical protein
MDARVLRAERAEVVRLLQRRGRRARMPAVSPNQGQVTPAQDSLKSRVESLREYLAWQMRLS